MAAHGGAEGGIERDARQARRHIRPVVYVLIQTRQRRRTPHQPDHVDLGQQRDRQVVRGDLRVEHPDAPGGELAREDRCGILRKQIADVGGVGRVARERDEHGHVPVIGPAQQPALFSEAPRLRFVNAAGA